MGEFQKFLEKTTRNGIHNAVMAKVNAVQQEMEKELQRKRDKLRTLMAMEEEYYARTLYELQQQIVDDKFEKNYENLEKMQNEREMERQKFVEMKRKQQHLLNCHEVRPRLQQALLEDSKKSQLGQIEEKRRLKQIEKDEEDMWLEIQRRTYEDKLSHERMEQSVRNDRDACTVKYLNWQVANKSDGKGSKRQEIEEERRLNALKMDEMKCYDAKERAEAVEKQRVFARDCKREIEARQNDKNERRTRDLNYEKLLSQFIQKELAATEAKKISDKERRRVETEHFLNFVEQQRVDRQLTEKEQEELLNTYRRKIDEEAYTKRQQLREHQRLLNEQVYVYQWKQITENRERILRELDEKRQEQLLAQQLHCQNMEMEEAALRAKRQQSIDLRKQLMEQDRRLQETKNDQQNDLRNAQHVCDVDDVISLHPNFRQILSFSQK